MQICRLLAGYSYAHADIVRRAMSKKKASAMQAERRAFISGCTERGISGENAEEIFDEMASFANYAFNKSHATAYGVISYRTAYLKAHYPAEYFSALLTSVLDNTAKLSAYIADAHKHGISVLAPDINQSYANFSVSGKNIRYGLLAIKNVGRTFAQAVINERKKKSFSSFEDFIRRMSEVDINKRTVEALIKCGVFDSLRVNRSALMASYEGIIDSEQSKRRNNISGQLDIFSLASSTDIGACGAYTYPDISEYTLRELLMLEKESSGMYFSGHMIDNYSLHIESLHAERISDILQDAEEENAERENGDTMAFIKLEDRYGEIEIIVFAKQYKRFSSEIFLENAVCVEGAVSFEDGDEVRILLSNLTPLETNSDFKCKRSSSDATAQKEKKEEVIYIKAPSISDSRITSLTRLALINPGNAKIVVYDSSQHSYHKLKDVAISPSEKVIFRLKSIFGEDCVVIK